MRTITIIVLLAAVLISGCGPSQEEVQATIQAGMEQTQVAMPTATYTPAPDPTPTNEYAQFWNNCLLGSSMSSEYFESLLGDETGVDIQCIYGVIRNKFETDEGDIVYQMHPDANIPFLIVARELDRIHEFVPNARGVLTTADIGDCIIVLGYPTQSDGAYPQFLAVDVIDLFQLGDELGVENETYKKISALCN